MDSTIAFADERQAFVVSDDEARELYEMREKAERDRRSEIAFAIEKGLLEGRTKGMEQGMQQGMRQGMEQGMRQGMEQGMQQGMEQGRLEVHKEVLGLIDKGYTLEDIRRELLASQ